MQRAIKKLRPKANKLKSYSSNWKRSNKELNIELANQITSLYQKETFPEAISMFFEIPMFKKVLKNLKEGSLWKDVYVFTEDDHHPPEEIQKVQNITNAFQRICSISHYPNYPNNKIAKAKILTENIHDYLFTILVLKSFKGKASKKIQQYLFDKQKEFLKELNKVLVSKENQFLLLKQHINIEKIKKINIKQLCIEDTIYVDEILAYLHICENNEKNTSYTCHKLLNQMHKEIELVYDSIVKNAPFYLPYALKKHVRKIIEKNSDSTSLYNSLELLFKESKYQIIETKQQSHSKNVQESCKNLNILQISLDLIWEKEDLPYSFKEYYKKSYLPIKDLLKQIHLQNSQIGYFLCGFFHTQFSYLLDLLSNKKETIPKIEFGQLFDDITYFLERYAKIKPELSQKDIKHILCFEHMSNLSYPYAKAFIEDTFSLILPQRNEKIFLSLEKDSRKILTNLLKIFKTMDASTNLSFLLKEKIKNLYLIDIPSLSLGWYIFGEISSCLYIIYKEQNKETDQTIIQQLEKLYQYPIFSILLKNKTL